MMVAGDALPKEDPHMEQPITQLELLCVRTADKADRQIRTHTATVVFTKPRVRRKLPSVMRRCTALGLSAVLLTATPEPGAILPDLVLQSEIAGFPATYSAADLPVFSFTEQLDEQTERLPADPAVTVPALPPIRLDTGLNRPANDRSSAGLLSRLFDSGNAETVRSLTIAPTSDYGYDAHGDILVANGSGTALDLTELFAEPLTLHKLTDEPKVLIYHTHACEAYTPGPLDSYAVDSSGRCTDPAYNVVRIGAEMTAMLRSYGIGVIHDSTLYDEESYNGAYARSLAAVQRILAKYPSIEVVIDVHRDALNQPDAQKYKLVSEIDGEECAQLMLVMGSDAAANDHPYWGENLKLALHMQDRLLARSATIMRPIKLTRSSYNQFTAPGAMILEVGANGNSLTEAAKAGQTFAEELAKLLLAVE